jgi:hypothetical protein
MASWGAFSAGARETVDFNDGKLPVLAFEMGFDESFVTFYQWRSDGNETDSDFVRSRICLDRRPCRYGGSRVYFICPACLRRALRLAVLPEGLRCRTCGRVTWGCRREQPIQRLIRRANKLASRLGRDGWEKLPAKRPTYMRQVEFHRLTAKHAELVKRINMHVASKLAGASYMQRLGYLARL